ncbi:MAG: hypothetical protein Tsb0014_01490 [Pleurocapsa sp.]
MIEEDYLGRPDFENLKVYQLAEKLANKIWDVVKKWESFSKNTIGKQIVRSADSIGANIAEGNDRYNIQDNQRFVNSCIPLRLTPTRGHS